MALVHSNNYTFNIQTVQSGAFRVLIEALKDILTDCNFIIDESGIKMTLKLDTPPQSKKTPQPKKTVKKGGKNRKKSRTRKLTKQKRKNKSKSKRYFTR